MATMAQSRFTEPVKMHSVIEAVVPAKASVPLVTHIITDEDIGLLKVTQFMTVSMLNF